MIDYPDIGWVAGWSDAPASGAAAGRIEIWFQMASGNAVYGRSGRGFSRAQVFPLRRARLQMRVLFL
ncbi:MAG TPA: hypothetical protein VNR40_10515, partial [Steroidobacter sp.]|nr:hypothetical protein [Steroidobacter sp.]